MSNIKTQSRTRVRKPVIPFHDAIGIALLLMSIQLFAASPENSPNSLFVRAQAHYDAKEYETALPLFQEAVKLAPMESIYHHMLGKCHGRIAEEGSWLTALRNVRKTLKAFKKAVELDPGNVQALKDLAEFYRRAPSFLGGNKKKARDILKQLSSLNSAEDSENPH